MCNQHNFQKDHYIQLLTTGFEVDGEEMTCIDWLKNYRIELDTVLAAAGPMAFWNWLKWKLEQVWPHRNYNRAIFLDTWLYTPTMDKFIEWYQKQSGEVIKDELDNKKKVSNKWRDFTTMWRRNRRRLKKI